MFDTERAKSLGEYTYTGFSTTLIQTGKQMEYITLSPFEIQ